MKGNLVDVVEEETYPAEIAFRGDCFSELRRTSKSCKDFILPGLIDSHVHIESSMLCPSKFAEAVVPHGTTAVVADPHEIANVLGAKGIRYMLRDSLRTPLRVFFTAPSCVPATEFDTSGARLGANEIKRLLRLPEFVALGEVMNFQGVLQREPELMKKIRAALKQGKRVDGHAPGLRGKALAKYVAAGITTDHECTSLEEANEKSALGMKVMVREGSSAKNMAGVIRVKGEAFLVSDDVHSTDLVKGHVNLLLKKAVALGIDPLKAIQMASLNPARHYGLNIGAVAPGKKADFIIVNNLKDFKVKQVFIEGRLVAQAGMPLFAVKPLKLANTFKVGKKCEKDFAVKAVGETVGKTACVRVIEVVEGQLLTRESKASLRVEEGVVLPDVLQDVLKLSVVERYGHNRVSNAFVSGFSLKHGALASSVAHDSHNIIAVGASGSSLAHAVNAVIESNGGLAVAKDGRASVLRLPAAGLMTWESASATSARLNRLLGIVRGMGCRLESPFTTLSFLALLVIPELRLSDRGLFDVGRNSFVEVIEGSVER